VRYGRRSNNNNIGAGMDSKLEAELKAITKERSRAIRETMALLQAKGVRIDRKRVAACVSNIMTAQRLGYVPKLDLPEIQRGRLLEWIQADSLCLP
jgi:hypothetical protein